MSSAAFINFAGIPYPSPPLTSPPVPTSPPPARPFRRASGAVAFAVGSLLAAAPAFAQPGPLSCADVERIALEEHPLLDEKSLEVDKALEKVRDLDMGVILPRFEVETGIGPAP